MSKVFANGVVYIDGRAIVVAGSQGHAVAKEECWVTVGGKKVKKMVEISAHAADIKNYSSLVYVHGNPVAMQCSTVSKTYGDESSEGGVISGTKQGSARFLTASDTHFIEGSPAVRHGDEAILNNDNSQVTQWVEPYFNLNERQLLTSSPMPTDLAEAHVTHVEWLRAPHHEASPWLMTNFIKLQHQETGECYYWEPKSSHWVKEGMRPGRYNVYEMTAHIAGTLYPVKIGELDSHGDADSPSGIKLIPLSFMRYNDIASTAEHAQYLPRNVYMYIFKDGYCWREFEICLSHSIRETDFYHQNKDGRACNAPRNQGIWLCTEDADGEHTYQICYTRVQWSLKKIAAMGGFAPGDERIPPEARPAPHLVNDDTIPDTLYPIDWKAFLANPQSIQLADNQTEQARMDELGHHQGVQPHNMAWYAARYGYNFSKGVTQYPYHLNWYEDEVQEHGILGGLVYYIDDPLTSLIRWSEEGMYQFGLYQQFQQDVADKITLSHLIDGVLKEAKADNKNYDKHLDVSAMHIYREEIEANFKAYEAAIEEAAYQTVYWLKQAIQKRVLHTLHELKYFSNLNDTLQVVIALLSQSNHGRALLQEQSGEVYDYFIETHQYAQKLARTEREMSFLKTMTALIASIHPLDDKLLRIMEEDIHLLTKSKVSLKWEVMGREQAFLQQEAVSTTSERHIKRSYIYRDKIVTQDFFNSNTQLKFKMLTANGMVVQHLSQLWESEMTETKLKVKYRAPQMLKDVIHNTPAKIGFAGGLAVLTAMSTRQLIEDLEFENELGHISDTERRLIHAQLVRNTLVVADLMAEATNLFRRGGRYKELSPKTLRIVRQLSIVTLLVSGAVDLHLAKKHFWEGEVYLSLGHLSSSASAFIGLFSILKIGRLLPLAQPISLVLAIMGMGLIYFFSKNEIEQWLFSCHWGKNQKELATPKQSIERIAFFSGWFVPFSCRDSQRSTQKVVVPYFMEHENLHPNYTNDDERLTIEFYLPEMAGTSIDVSLYKATMHGLLPIDSDITMDLRRADKRDMLIGRLVLPRNALNVGGPGSWSLIGKLKIVLRDPVNYALTEWSTFHLHQNERGEYSIKKVMDES